jgi:glycerol-3-phosphate acyltransferase PlsY
VLGYAVVAVIGYVAGAIPFSYVAGRMFGGIDLREHGSGNLGASNTFRLLGPKIASVVLVGDIAKGFLPVYFAPALASTDRSDALWAMLVAGFFAVLGHMFSCFVGFRGGKGIATTAGAFLALDPWALLATFAVWASVMAQTRIVSVASMAAAVALPFVVYLFGRLGIGTGGRSVLVLAIAVTVIVIAKHRSNIQRLMAGTEPVLQRTKRQHHG